MPIYHTAALDGDHRLALARKRWASLPLCPSYGRRIAMSPDRLASARRRWASLPLCPSYGRRIATSPGLQAVGTSLELLEAVTQA